MSRGRGGGKSFNLEQLGLQRGDIHPVAVYQPPALYPLSDATILSVGEVTYFQADSTEIEHRPLPFSDDEEYDQLLSTKQEFRKSMTSSDFFIKPPVAKKFIEDYTDRCLKSLKITDNLLTTLDWARFPKELRPIRDLRPKRKLNKSLSVQRKRRKNVDGMSVNIEDKLKELEAKEDVTSDHDSDANEKGDDEDGNLEDDENYDEAEQEEDTDYAAAYFDNGESYLDEEDDNLDDDPTY